MSSASHASFSALALWVQMLRVCQSSLRAAASQRLHNCSSTGTTVCRDTIGRSGNPIPKWRITVALSPYLISALCTLHSAVPCLLDPFIISDGVLGGSIRMYLLPIPPLIRSLFQMVFLVYPYVPPAYPTPQPGARLLPDPLPRVLMAVHRPLPGLSLKIR
jgi:hypothetical protein